MLEVIGEEAHDNRPRMTFAWALSQAPSIDSGAVLMHIAWLPHTRRFDGWYGVETVFSAAYLNAKGHGIDHEIRGMTLGPITFSSADTSCSKSRTKEGY